MLRFKYNTDVRRKCNNLSNKLFKCSQTKYLESNINMAS